MMLTLLLAAGITLPSQLPEPPADFQAVVTGNNQFALDLCGQLQSQDGNVFFAPYSIYKTLAMAYAGARGDTEREMAGALHFGVFPQERQPRAFLEVRKLLNRGQASAPGLSRTLPSKRRSQLYLSASVWGQRGHGFRKEFLSLLEDSYGAALQEVDFGAPEASRRTINSWVERQTHLKIPELFQASTLPITTRLVLASAIYFKGDWQQSFPLNRTSPEPFWINPETSVRASLMKHKERFVYFEDEQLQALQLPYEGKDLAMLVILPKEKDGLADVEKALTTERLALLMAWAREQTVDVALPKFKLAGEFDLKDTLAALGMKKAFVSGEADFSGMSAGGEPLAISAVAHKAFIEVNEAGTEAAAATGAAVGALSLPAGTVAPVFRADHPFIFAIYDVKTGMVLFLGRVVRPIESLRFP